MNSFFSLFLSPWLLTSGEPTTSPKLFYEVRATHNRAVSARSLHSAKTMSDFCVGFPKNWITQYVSTEVVLTNGNKTERTIGKNDSLTNQQQQILKTAVLDSEIDVVVRFMAENPVSHYVSMRTMEISMTVTPQEEASFGEGYPKLSSYLYENAVRKITPADSASFQDVKILFTVSEDGSVANIRLLGTSGKPESDALIMETLRTMPKWNPAKDDQGKAVKQSFQFTVTTKQGC
jgi:TonB family protein